MSFLANALMSIAHPMLQFGNALANTPEAIYREMQNKPIDDIQQRVFGTTNPGQIGANIAGDTLGTMAMAAPIARVAGLPFHAVNPGTLSHAIIQSQMKPAADNDVIGHMWLDYFKNKSIVPGSGLTGEGAMAPKFLSPEAKAELMAKMRRPQ